MEKYIELGFSDIKRIMLAVGSFDVEKRTSETVLSRKLSSFHLEITLAQTKTEIGPIIAIDGIDGDESTPVIRCREISESGDDQFTECEPLKTGGLKGRICLYDYGPVEKASATVSDFLEPCINYAMEKMLFLGADFLNEYEKKLLEYRDYICFVENPFSVRFSEMSELKKARKCVENGSPLAAAFDAYMEESFGLTGRKNLLKLKKELKRHRKTDFDSEKYVSLCENAVKDFQVPYGSGGKEQYDNVVFEISRLMKNAGYSGEYPCYSKGEKYVNFVPDFSGYEMIMFARFGISGEKPKKYVNPVTGSDMLLMPAFSEKNEAETKKQLGVYIDGITDALEGKAVSGEFKQIIISLHGGKSHVADSLYGIICMILALSLAAIIIAGAAQSEAGFAASLAADKLQAAAGFVSSAVLFAFGAYMSFFRGRRTRFLRRDKGD